MALCTVSEQPKSPNGQHTNLLQTEFLGFTYNKFIRVILKLLLCMICLGTNGGVLH